MSESRIVRIRCIARCGIPPPDTTAPSISNVSDPAGGLWTVDVQVILSFDVSDDQTPEALIVVSGISNDQNIVANGGIVAGGSGANRTLTFTPASAGSVTITIIARDLAGNEDTHGVNALVIS